MKTELKTVLLMIGTIVLLIIYFFSGQPVPVSDPGYKDYCNNFNLYFFKDRLFLMGGNYVKQTTTRWHPHWVPGTFTFEFTEGGYSEVPNDVIYTTSDLQTITGFANEYFNRGRSWPGISGYEISKYKKNWVGSGIHPDKALSRTDALFFNFSGKIWCLGGKHITNDYNYDDVWNSGDGIHWNCISSKVPWSGFIDYWMSCNPVVFRNEIWVYVRVERDTLTSDEFWSSANGAEWNSRGKAPEIGSPKNFCGTEDFLCLYGENPDANGWIVLISYDGRNWSRANFPISEYENLVMLKYKKRYYAFGNGDIFISGDGLNWKKTITGHPEVKHAYIGNNKLVIFNKEGISESTNGASWELIYRDTTVQLPKLQ